MKTNRLLRTALIGICALFEACDSDHPDPKFIWPTDETYLNWYISDGEVETFQLDSGCYAIKLVGERVVITRRLQHLDPEYDPPVQEEPDDSPFYQVPVMAIIGKAEPEVAMSLVIEEIRKDPDLPDSGFAPEDADSGDFETASITPVTQAAPSGTVVISQTEIPFELTDDWGNRNDDWDRVTVELPILPYDPDIEGYEVHISIVKRGEQSAFFYSGFIWNEGKLKKESE